MFGMKPTRNGQVYSSPAWKWVRAVTKAIAKGLEQDGKVSIQGFGTFRTVKVKAHVHKLVSGVPGSRKGVVHYANRPVTTRVFFKASPSLKKLINEGVEDDGT